MAWRKSTCPPVGAKLAQMYEAMDVLHEHREAVEETVFFHTANLMNLEVDLIFYDTTTVSFSIDYEDEDDDEAGEGMRKFGHSFYGHMGAAGGRCLGSDP